jgi:hypothetical protein
VALAVVVTAAEAFAVGLALAEAVVEVDFSGAGVLLVTGVPGVQAARLAANKRAVVDWRTEDPRWVG